MYQRQYSLDLVDGTAAFVNQLNAQGPVGLCWNGVPINTHALPFDVFREFALHGAPYFVWNRLDNIIWPRVLVVLDVDNSSTRVKADRQIPVLKRVMVWRDHCFACTPEFSLAIFISISLTSLACSE